MRIDALVAEIGSTTTIVNAFMLDPKCPEFLGQGVAPTSVADGDVAIGLNLAKTDLKRNLKLDALEYDRFLATSSAAGGLRMTVHGLVYDMTVKAGQEAALGAGANIVLATAGKISKYDLHSIKQASPNLILLSGGTDYGDKEIALQNCELLLQLEELPPVIYCGNIQNQKAIKGMFEDAKRKLYITENVYPRLDELNIEPVKKLIHQAFEEHIVHAPGMENIRKVVNGSIIPTPGAVMQAAQVLHNVIGDLMVIDIGGATTDIHSVTKGNDDIAEFQIAPEPMAKRTVEGDLGLFINAKVLAEIVGHKELSEEIGHDCQSVLSGLPAVPKTVEQLNLVHTLSFHAGKNALTRHAGRITHSYTPKGRKAHVFGKDLTAVKHLIATGGALTRLPKSSEIMKKLANFNSNSSILLPKENTLKILTDSKYIMASIGVLSKEFPEAARALLKKYVNELS